MEQNNNNNNKKKSDDLIYIKINARIDHKDTSNIGSEIKLI